MMDRVVALIVDEGKWPAVSLSLALLAVLIQLYGHRQSTLPARRRVMAAMNLFFGVTIGTMAFGHLLAVTTKIMVGTLEGSILVLYLIGIVLAVPSGWLIHRSRESLDSDGDQGRTTMVLNACLAITLLGLGVQNLPLAAPALLNIGYHLHSRRAMGWAIVSTAVVVNAGLLIGSLIFLASGQSFEQFRGLE